LGFPIRRKLFLSHFLSVVLVSGSIGTFLYASALNNLFVHIQTRLKYSAGLISQNLNPQELAVIQTARDTRHPIYQKTLRELRRLKSTNPDIAFIYIMRRQGRQVYFVIDSDDTPEQALPGTLYPEPPETLMKGFLDPSVDQDFTADQWGAFLSGYFPLPNSDGNYLVGIDMRANEVQHKFQELQLTGLISLLCSLLLALIFSRFISERLITPIHLLVDRCRELAKGHLGGQLQFQTGDELDELIQNFNYMSQSLDQSQKELLEAKVLLEQRINERTQELVNLNSKLMDEVLHRRSTEEKLIILARTDSLTNLLNRRTMLEHFDYESIRFHRLQSPLSLVMADIDHFKQINDNLGHDQGDQVIQSVAQLMRNLLREQDLVARWGGEEFLILLPDTDLTGAILVAEKLRQVVCENVGLPRPIAAQPTSWVTLSLGVTTLNQGQTTSECIKVADRALYQAKRLGRNQVHALSTDQG
jgi:diguanylate cyclase (GGDEF)-like protein